MLLARLLAVAPPPAAWCRALPTRGGRLVGGPSSLTLSEGLLRPASQEPRARLLTAAQLSPIHQESAGHGLPSVSQPVSQQAGRCFA